jgi:Na+-translocating ferredoxin:NAD+ oxidoreductase subunit C
MPPSKAWPKPEKTITNAFIPTTAVICLKQTGARQARCLVSPGESVEECQIIGRAETPDAANVHSSIPGTVRQVKKIKLADGSESEAVFIDFGGAFKRLGRRQEKFTWKGLSVHELAHIIGERGVLGRSGEPLASLLAAFKQNKAKSAFIDCLDSEPFQCAERSCLLAKPAEMAEGLEIILKIIGSAPVTVLHRMEGAEECAGFLAEMAQRGTEAKSIALRDRYPSTHPALLKTRFGREQAQSAALAERIAVFSPTTLLAAYEAVTLNKASIEQVVTVAGDAVRRPATLRARLGMRIGDLIEECGGLRGGAARIVLGGALTGPCVTDLDHPILKSTFSIIALTPGEIRRAPAFACIHCGRCISACPAGIDPGLILKLIQRERRDDAREEGVGRCFECAACAYICPSRLPLLGEISRALSKGWAAR